MKKMQESEASHGTASRETKRTVFDCDIRMANEMKKIEEEMKAEDISTRSSSLGAIFFTISMQGSKYQGHLSVKDDEKIPINKQRLAGEQGMEYEEYNQKLSDPDGSDFLITEDLCDYEGNRLTRVLASKKLKEMMFN